MRQVSRRGSQEKPTQSSVNWLEHHERQRYSWGTTQTKKKKKKKKKKEEEKEEEMMMIKISPFHSLEARHLVPDRLTPPLVVKGTPRHKHVVCAAPRDWLAMHQYFVPL